MIKWFAGICVLENIFTFIYWIWIIDLSQQYCIVYKKKKKKKKKKNEQSDLIEKSTSKIPTLQISAWFAFNFIMGKSENIWFFKNQWLE